MASRGAALWRLAWLLTGSEPAADTLLDGSLVQTLPRRAELAREGAGLEAGVRRALVRTWLGEHPASSPAPGRRDGDAAPDDTVVGRRLRTLAVLSALPARERAAVVLAGLGDLAPWDAADALDVDPAGLDRLVAAGRASALPLDRDAGQLLASFDLVLPVPPFAAGRARAVRERVAAVERGRRRRTVLALLGVVLFVGAPVLLSSRHDPPARSEPAEAALAVAGQLVDPLPVPHRCGGLPDGPPSPDHPYTVEGADAVWMRFCSPVGAGRRPGVLPFAPHTTIVAQEVDEVVDSWVSSQDGPNPCNYASYEHQGLVRLWVGTLDGALHVVDLRIGTCGKVSVDSADLAVDGRTAFADAVELLGTELLDQVDEPGVVPPAAAVCPPAPAGMGDLERTTVPDLPPVAGLALPLPARSTLLCRYAPVPGRPGRVSVDDALLDPVDSETLRAAYLAHPGPAADPRPGRQPRGECRGSGPVTRYAVLVTDVTGSRRAFTVDLGGCSRLAGPGGDSGTAGVWLSEVLTSGFSQLV